ncbi:hypothetical protein ACSQ76_06050 [Roseovarius sp. B08]|uniref:hypothetical protein n=1 Tax=Roseovarius sp. B08 TaxID=3449223 RepID=UPI003EDBFE9D
MRAWYSFRMPTICASLKRFPEHGGSQRRRIDPLSMHGLAAHVGDAGRGAGVYDELKNLIVWAKDNGGMGTFYRSRHELIFVFKKGKAAHINTFELGQHGRVSMRTGSDLLRSYLGQVGSLRQGRGCADGLWLAAGRSDAGGRGMTNKKIKLPVQKTDADYEVGYAKPPANTPIRHSLPQRQPDVGNRAYH